MAYEWSEPTLDGWKFMFLLAQGSKQMDQFNNRLKNLEVKMRQLHPLGGKSYFYVTHGSNYSKFFQHLGRSMTPATFDYYLIWAKNSQQQIGPLLIGTAAAVLQSVPINHPLQGKSTKQVWYLCDLKILKEFRGNGLTRQLLMYNYPSYGLFAAGYLISMDPTSNQIKGIFSSLMGINHGPQLAIFNISKDKMKLALPILEKHFGGLSFLSHAGTKDLIGYNADAKQTQPLAVWHLQHGAMAASRNVGSQKGESFSTVTKLFPDSTFMFCVIKDSRLYTTLCSKIGPTSTTCTIISKGMQHFDWQNILTSDI